MSNTIRSKILIIEDDPGICTFLRATLTAEGYDAIVVSNGGSALEMAASHCPDCILLDLGLPDMDGNEIISGIRQWSVMPIIVISARSMEQDKVQALDLGADDYITKPFGTDELLARIRTALRHRRTVSENDEVALQGSYHVGDMVIDYRKHRVCVGSETIHLTPNEYKIVALLGLHAGQVMTYKAILRELWDLRPARTTRYCACTWPVSDVKSSQILMSRDISSRRSAWDIVWRIMRTDM